MGGGGWGEKGEEEGRYIVRIDVHFVLYQLVCRCSQCRAIRTGGGYIILDLGDENGRLKTGDGIRMHGPLVVMLLALVLTVNGTCV